MAYCEDGRALAMLLRCYFALRFLQLQLRAFLQDYYHPSDACIQVVDLVLEVGLSGHFERAQHELRGHVG